MPHFHIQILNRGQGNRVMLVPDDNREYSLASFETQKDADMACRMVYQFRTDSALECVWASDACTCDGKASNYLTSEITHGK